MVSPEIHMALPLRSSASATEDFQAVLRGVRPVALLVHSEVEIVQGRPPRAGAEEIIVGALAATRLGVPEKRLEIVVRGRIGGRSDPMSADLAVFVMMDPSVPSCADLGHGCPKPWDFCCESQDSRTTNSATVQLVDPADGPVRVDLAAYGFKPLDEVVVVGTVGPRPGPEVLMIRARKIHRVAGS